MCQYLFFVLFINGELYINNCLETNIKNMSPIFLTYISLDVCLVSIL